MYKKFGLIFILVIYLLSFTGCSSLYGQERVFLIGIDGADWEAMNPMIKKGELPNIKKLMDSGCYGYLATDIAMSPTSWTSIITGKSMEKHGIDANMDATRTSDAINIKTSRLWDILLYKGKKVGVYDWYFTQPYREIDGFWVPINYPLYPLPPEIRVELEAADSGDGDLLIYLIDKYNCDFVAAFWHSVDAYQHSYWLYHVLKESVDQNILPLKIKKEIDDNAEAIYSSYRQFDNKIGRLLERLGKNDSVVIVSDHGSALWLEKHIKIRKNLLLRLGIIREGWLDDSETLAQGSLLGARFKLEIQEAPLYKSPVFSSGILKEYEENVRMPLINIIFDENMDSEHDYEAAMQTIIDIFKNITSNGINIFDLKEKGQYKLIFELTKEARSYCEEIRHPMVDNEFLEINILTGSHREKESGIIILNGKPFKKNYKIQGAHLFDITPTILCLMNLPVGKDMDGKVLESAFRPPLFRKPRYIDSYDNYISLPGIGSLEDRPISEKEKARLRSLGYIQ